MPNPTIRFTKANGTPYPDWANMRLGDIIQNITTGKEDANAMKDNGQYRFYTCAKDYFRIDKYAFDTEAILISGNGANVGYIHYFKGKFNAYQRTYVLTGFGCNVHFLKYLLECTLKSHIEKEASISNTPYIRLSTITDFELTLPTDAEEQQKIANFFTALDEEINAENTKLAEMQAYKKSMLQKIFSREIAFGSEEWASMRLGDVADIFRGGSPRPISQYITKSQENSIGWLKIGDISEDSKYIYSTEERIIEEGIKSSRIVNPNDLILSNSMSFGRPYIMKIKACIHDGWLTIQLKTIHPEFMYYLLSSPVIQKKFIELAQGSSVNNLKKEIVESVDVTLPTNVEEQEKIANFFSTLDEQIRLQQLKADNISLYKKSMLQQMFI